MASPAYLEEHVQFAVRLADAGRKVMSAQLASLPDVEIKPDSSYVTQTDKAIERELRELISGAYPAHGILGEEYGAERADAEHVWVLDPIDGTAAFVAGLPVFGTLIALMHRGKPVVGIIDHLMTNDRWIGAAGRPSMSRWWPMARPRSRPRPRSISASSCGRR